MEEKKTAGCVGIKFEIAYFRSLHFDDPPEERAARDLCEVSVRGVPTTPITATSRISFSAISYAKPAGSIYPSKFTPRSAEETTSAIQDGNIIGLENVLRDPRYENVTFDLLHKGFPYHREAIWLAARKNVYLDSSLMGILFIRTSSTASSGIGSRRFQDKIVFGSDTFPLSEAIGTEEGYWLALQSARTALLRR